VNTLSVLALSLGTAVFTWREGLPQAAVLFLLGVGYGWVFQRSRLCFASAFYGNRELLRAILLGLAVASVGSAVVVDLGWNRPPRLPFGLHTLVGSFLFGLAMPFCGGCMTGTLFRLGSGQAKSLAAFLGILVGNGVGAAWAWRITEPLLELGFRFQVADFLGLWTAVALNFAVLGLLYWRLQPQPGADRGVAVPRRWNLLRDPWPAWLGGVALALLFVAQFAYHSALAIQLPLARSVLWVAQAFGAPVGDLPWVRFWGLRLPALDPGVQLDVGLITGAVLGAVATGEFGYFRHSNTREALTGFAGGLLMGVAVWVAIGCNVSGFWSAVATVRFEGWLYAAGLYAGAQLGLRAVRGLVTRGVL
jgi:uncharacterized membrane protein YedE/YeeE